MKEKLAKLMTMARKQMAVLICAGIVIISVVLAYWPTAGLYADLSARVEKSVTDAQSMDKLIKMPRNLPNIGPDPNAPAQPLPGFPTARFVKDGKEAVKAFDDQSTALLTLAVQLNEHFPLTLNALPNGNNVDRDTFARDFKNAVAGDSYIRHWPPTDVKEHFKNLFEIPDLAAGQAPSADEVQNLENEDRNDVQKLFPNGQNSPDMAQRVAERTTADLLRMYVDRAKACKVYLAPGAISPPNVLTNFNQAVAALPPSDIWAAQLWLWVVQDAATSVARANGDAHNVLDAPIKQILSLTVKEPPYLVSGDPTQGGETTALPSVFDATPTGRVSNGMYDVLQFSMSLDVDADRAPEVLDLLGRGQFITILSVQYTALDSSERAVKGYIYGNSRIVRLDLICEDLYLKSWSGKYCPQGSGPSATASPSGGGAPGTANTGNMLNITTHAQ